MQITCLTIENFQEQTEFVGLIDKGELNEDNFADFALIYDKFDPLDQAQSESMTPIVNRIRDILSPILQAFFTVNTNNPEMQEAFTQSLDYDDQDSLSTRVHLAIKNVVAESLDPDFNKFFFS